MPTVNLDRRITIQSKTLAANEYGEAIETWADHIENLPAEFMPVGLARGNESMLGKEMTARTAGQFRIRYRTDVLRTMRVVYDGLTYDLSDATEDRRFDRRQYMVLTGWAEVG